MNRTLQLTRGAEFACGVVYQSAGKSAEKGILILLDEHARTTTIKYVYREVVQSKSYRTDASRSHIKTEAGVIGGHLPRSVIANDATRYMLEVYVGGENSLSFSCDCLVLMEKRRFLGYDLRNLSRLRKYLLTVP